MKNYLHNLGSKSSYKIRGFTLIEMMVVIAIIGLLSAIIITNLSASRGKARDAKRISDLGNIQLALELYFDRCGQYPAYVTTPPATGVVANFGNSGSLIDFNNGIGVTCPSSISLKSYISKIPAPPTGFPQTFYDYVVNDSKIPTDYFLHATLEYPNEVVKDGLKPPVYNVSPAVPCSDVPATKEYCIGPK